MYTPYRGRCHTKKHNCRKPKLSPAKRKARNIQKRLEKLFPGITYYWLAAKYKSIYQHSVSSIQNKNAV